MLIVAHGITISALYTLPFPVWAKIALVFFILLSMVYHLWREAWLSAPSSAVALLLEEDNLAVLTQHNGKQLNCKILCDSLVTPFLTILNVLPQDSRMAQSIIILPDSMDSVSFRQLRVRLKWSV